MKKVIDTGKRSKTLSKGKSVEKRSKNPQSFSRDTFWQMELLLSHKLQDHAQQQNYFQLKRDDPSQRNCQNQLSHPSLSLIEQERHESLTQKRVTFNKI